MSLEEICKVSKQYTDKIIHYAQLYVEPATWQEFTSTKNPETEIYRILDSDFPFFRDLKALLNILTAIRQIAYKLSLEASLTEASITEKWSILYNLRDFRDNFQIYMATSNIVSQHLDMAKDYFIQVMIPLLKDKFAELYELMTEENIDKISNFFIQSVITLEKYQDNYKEYLLIKSQLPVENPDDLKHDDVITAFVKQKEAVLQNIEKLNAFLMPKEKAKKIEGAKIEGKEAGAGAGGEKKPEDLIDYYPEIASDSDVIKNVKLFMNGIIGIKKVLDDQSHYQFNYHQSYYLASFSNLVSLQSNLRKVYSSFRDFDYQAIIAETSGPGTEKIKDLIGELNGCLEILACKADLFEAELRLTEGSLLKLVERLVVIYDQITMELRVSVELMKQKNNFYQARAIARKAYLKDIDEQIKEVSRFLPYQNYAIADLPLSINYEIRDYIAKYRGDICMNKSNLEKYHDHLVEVLKENFCKSAYLSGILKEKSVDWPTFFWNQLDWTGRCRKNLHAEFMKMLTQRLLYFQKQREYATHRFAANAKYFNEHPYQYFELNEIEDSVYKKTLLKVLHQQNEILKAENEKLQSEIAAAQSAPPVEKNIGELAAPSSTVSLSLEAKSTLTEMKPSSSRELVKQGSKQNLLMDHVKYKQTKPNPRLANRAKIKADEYALFKAAVKNYEEIDNHVPLFDMIKHPEGQSPKTVFLLNEVGDVIKTKLKL